ncbi:MAG TPA: MBL fold metallo-hydrolase [Gammaproteobacteria bacterium]|nr:MBL fold metallo-hydrolase [Gammaproteobacteria bacterium]
MKKNPPLSAANRRRVLAAAIDLAAAGALLGSPLLARAKKRAADTPRAGGAPAGPGPGPAPLPPGTHIVLLGTQAGPGVSLTRTQTSSVVVVDGVPYLVDCGYGAVRQLTAANVGVGRINTVFLSHLHNDHTSDLVALFAHQFTGNKATPTEVYGPPGTEALVRAAGEFLRADVEIRTVDEGRTNRTDMLVHGHDVAVTATPTLVFRDDRVTVITAENTHFPDRAKQRMTHRSLAYRFETKDRSIVFSGDTAYSKNLVELARGADLFVCEVMAQSVYDRNMETARADAAAGRADSVARHVAETHSTPADVGRMATEAKVKTVVLYHQIAGQRAPNSLDTSASIFVDGVHSQFSGEVIVGQDLMVL